MTVKYTLLTFFRSDLTITPQKKNDTILNKKGLYFLKTTVGTFCAICKVAGYPCFNLFLFEQ